MKDEKFGHKDDSHKPKDDHKEKKPKHDCDGEDESRITPASDVDGGEILPGH
jgi:hypothetical protein